MTAITVSRPGTVSRRATLGAVGGALWLLLPAVWAVGELDSHDYGSLAFVAVTLSYGICLVLAPALVAVGYTALRTALGRFRIGAAGAVVSAVGMAAMAVGNGIELASISAGGGEVALGHVIFLVGFLVALVGGVLAGIPLIRRYRDPLARSAGWLLTLALPLGIGIGYLGFVVAPDNDAGFWAAISLPTGAAWLLLGRHLTTEHRGLAPEHGGDPASM